MNKKLIVALIGIVMIIFAMEYFVPEYIWGGNSEEAVIDETSEEDVFEQETLESDSIIFNEVAVKELSEDETINHDIVTEVLAKEQIEILLPELSNQYELEGYVNFYELADGEYMLSNVEILATAEETTQIYITYDKCGKVYTWPEEIMTSSIETVEVTSGFYKGEDDEIVYFSEFMLETTAYHIEIKELPESEMEEMLYKIVAKVIKGGAAELGIVVAEYTTE